MEGSQGATCRLVIGGHRNRWWNWGASESLTPGKEESAKSCRLLRGSRPAAGGCWRWRAFQVVLFHFREGCRDLLGWRRAERAWEFWEKFSGGRRTWAAVRRVTPLARKRRLRYDFHSYVYFYMFMPLSWWYLNIKWGSIWMFEGVYWVFSLVFGILSLLLLTLLLDFYPVSMSPVLRSLMRFPPLFSF